MYFFFRYFIIITVQVVLNVPNYHCCSTMEEIQHQRDGCYCFLKMGFFLLNHFINLIRFFICYFKN